MLTPHPVADAFRVAEMVGAGILLGQIVLVVSRYARSYRRSQGSGHQWRGLLPKHVVFVGLSYLIGVASLTVSVTNNAHRPLNPYFYALAATLLTGVLAMRSMLRHQRLVRDALPGKVRPDERLDDLSGL